MLVARAGGQHRQAGSIKYTNREYIQTGNMYFKVLYVRPDMSVIKHLIIDIENSIFTKNDLPCNVPWFIDVVIIV